MLQPSFHRVTRCKSMPPNSFIVQFFSNFSKNFFNFSLQKLFLQNRLRDLRIRLRKKHFRLREFEVTGETRRWQHSCNRFYTEKQRVNFRWQECKEFHQILWFWPNLGATSIAVYSENLYSMSFRRPKGGRISSTSTLCYRDSSLTLWMTKCLSYLLPLIWGRTNSMENWLK